MVSKLRADQRRGSFEFGVIVSDVLPESGCSFCQVDGIVACDMDAAPYLAVLLRERLIEVAGIRGARARRDDLKGAVYDYISGPFTTHIGSAVESLVSMKATVDREKRAKEADRRQREADIDGVALELAAIYGDLKGIGAALPTLTNLELPGTEVQSLPTGTS